VEGCAFLQKSHHKRGALFLRGVWLVIAGVLLLGPPAVLAESYIKVWEKGVVYYYFSGRKPSQPRQAKIITPGSQRVRLTPPTRAALPGAQALIPQTDQPHNLWPRLIKAVSRMEANRHLKGAPDLGQLRLRKADGLPVVNAVDPTENMWTGPRYLGRLLAKIGCRSPLGSAAANPGFRQEDRYQDLPPIQEIQALVRDAGKNFLEYAREVGPGAYRFAGSNQLHYCFPVAPPYSFRDTWWDYRSGGRYHHAVDIFAAEGTPIYAITAGVIHKLAFWPDAGITLFLQGQDGKGYGYMHLQGYAEGIVEGKTVQPGELIAYLGHTGIRNDSAHLHLQAYGDDSFARDKLVDPYGLLVQLCNGKGVTDLFYPKIARSRIPTVEVIGDGTVNLSSSGPPRYQGHQGRTKNARVFLTNSY
jgi:murein DD-endopeptidase MepM/ murein hydrolase activator NlpD